MTRKSRKTQRRIIASLMTGVFMLQQTMALTVVASDISGVTGVNGVYNIDPAHITGDLGFRQYENFNLSEGDIANLNFADISTFINMVDNQIVVNGLVNSVRNGNFYDGKAVFISPNGMVVGASGVLNVGSLSVYSPDQYGYNQLKKNQTAEGFQQLKNDEINTGGPISINGKVISAGDVELRASAVNVGKDGGIMAGVNQNAMQTLLSNQQADALFNNLVNTDNLNTANQFASDANGHIIITSEGNGTPNDQLGTNIAGTVKNFATGNESSTTIMNYHNANGGLTISGDVSNAKGNVLINNNDGNLIISGNVKNNGKTKIENATRSDSQLKISGNVNTKGDLDIINTANKGLEISGTVNHDGNATVQNGSIAANAKDAAGMYISGTFNTTGDASFLNTAAGSQGMNVSGNVNVGGNGTFTNNGAGGLNVANSGNIIANNNITMTNTGEQGINVSGNVKTNVGNIYTDNTGAEGTYIASSGRINSASDVFINDNSAGGTKVQGLVNAKNNVNVNQKGGGDVVIGDNTDNDNYISAGNNIDITVNDGSILNYGVEKVLLKANGDLTMTVTDGTIGLPVQQAACQGSGCTGIGPKEDGSRDFTKSVNANIKGKVNASTTNTKNAMKPEDLVINYAAIDSDMNIDTIKADGRVILTVDDDYGEDNNGTRYNMVNARPDDNSKTNVEGWGISLIANGSIGAKDNPITFIQTEAAEGYSMDALANENINLKENSFNDANYGRDNEIKDNKVCTMIAREGDLNVEFAGNTTIENITAEGDMNIVTRGKTLEIQNLGHIEDDSVTPNDYFGPHHDGYEFDKGYDKDDHKSEILPNHVNVKALDINHNIRPTEEIVDGHEAWAGSSVTVHNATIDNGTLDITADNIYANGIEVHFTDEFTKNPNDKTSKVQGVVTGDGLDLPIGHAVRPDDVTDTGRNETERN